MEQYTQFYPPNSLNVIFYKRYYSLLSKERM